MCLQQNNCMVNCMVVLSMLMLLLPIIVFRMVKRMVILSMLHSKKGYLKVNLDVVSKLLKEELCTPSLRFQAQWAFPQGLPST